MFRTLKVKRDDKLTTITLSQDIYELLSLKLGTSPDSPESLPLVREWMQQTINQHSNPEQRNFSQWIAGQAVRFLADKKTQAAYQDWLGDTILSGQQEDAIISEPGKDTILSEEGGDSIISEPYDKQRGIAQAKALKDKGQSWASIAGQLNQDGIPTPTGRGL